MPSSGRSFYYDIVLQQIREIPGVKKEIIRRVKLGIEDCILDDANQIRKGLKERNQNTILELQDFQRELNKEDESEIEISFQDYPRFFNINFDVLRERDESIEIFDEEISSFLPQSLNLILLYIVIAFHCIFNHLKYIPLFIICHFFLMLCTIISQTYILPQILIFFVVNMIAFLVLALLKFIDMKLKNPLRNVLYNIGNSLYLGGLINLAMWYFKVSGSDEKFYNFLTTNNSF